MAQVGTPIGHNMMGNAAENGHHMLVAMDTQYLTHHQLVQQSYSNKVLAGADQLTNILAFVEAVNADGSYTSLK